MDLDLDDKHVVVTGGASNIGRAIVLAFAGQHANITLIDIDATRAQHTRQQAIRRGASHCEVVRADLGQPDHAEATMTRVLDQRGSVDVLINNLGLGAPGLLLDSDTDTWDALWRLNLASTVACSRTVLADMRTRQRGTLVCIASDAAQGVANQSVYGAVKAGVVSFTRSVAREFGRYGVRANVVSPGLVVPEPDDVGANSIWHGDEPVLTDEQIEATLALSALRRPTRASDVAHTVLFLSSEVSARQVTGQLISVSGGWWMP